MIKINKYLKQLQEKCNMSEGFIYTVDSLLEKLIDFSYISGKDKLRLSKKILENIDIIIIGNAKKIDYKSGYYDPLKKELYIKDINDMNSIYLRLIYVLTTSNLKEDIYSMGYSKAYISKKSYKVDYEFFGINRAIISNLVCRLLYTTPQSLEILPTYRNYKNDFIGKEITSDNNIYFLEGKLLKQLLFVTNIKEEKLYENLFKSKPYNRLLKLFKNFDFAEILNIFDKISREYSNYSKLCFFNKLSQKTYIQLRKHSLEKDEKWQNLNKLDRDIHAQIINILTKMFNLEDEEEILEISLKEGIDKLEEEILTLVNNYQVLLVDILFEQKHKYQSFNYCKILRKFDKILILDNLRVQKELYLCISKHIMDFSESDSTNILQKIRYSMIKEFISEHTLSNFLSEISFNIIEDDFQNNKLIIIQTTHFNRLLIVKNLDLDIEKLNDNIEFIEGENLKLLYFSKNSNSNKVEELFEKTKNLNKDFKDIMLDDISIYKRNGTQFLSVHTKNENYILGLTKNFDMNILNKSKEYSLIKKND